MPPTKPNRRTRFSFEDLDSPDNIPWTSQCTDCTTLKKTSEGKQLTRQKIKDEFFKGGHSDLRAQKEFAIKTDGTSLDGNEQEGEAASHSNTFSETTGNTENIPATLERRDENPSTEEVTSEPTSEYASELKSEPVVHRGAFFRQPFIWTNQSRLFFSEDVSSSPLELNNRLHRRSYKGNAVSIVSVDPHTGKHIIAFENNSDGSDYDFSDSDNVGLMAKVEPGEANASDSNVFSESEEEFEKTKVSDIETDSEYEFVIPQWDDDSLQSMRRLLEELEHGGYPNGHYTIDEYGRIVRLGGLRRGDPGYESQQEKGYTSSESDEFLPLQRRSFDETDAEAEADVEAPADESIPAPRYTRHQRHKDRKAERKARRVEKSEARIKKMLEMGPSEVFQKGGPGREQYSDSKHEISSEPIRYSYNFNPSVEHKSTMNIKVGDAPATKIVKGEVVKEDSNDVNYNLNENSNGDLERNEQSQEEDNEDENPDQRITAEVTVTEEFDHRHEQVEAPVPEPKAPSTVHKEIEVEKKLESKTGGKKSVSEAVSKPSSQNSQEDKAERPVKEDIKKSVKEDYKDVKKIKKPRVSSQEREAYKQEAKKEQPKKDESKKEEPKKEHPKHQSPTKEQPKPGTSKPSQNAQKPSASSAPSKPAPVSSHKSSHSPPPPAKIQESEYSEEEYSDSDGYESTYQEELSNSPSQGALQKDSSSPPPHQVGESDYTGWFRGEHSDEDGYGSIPRNPVEESEYEYSDAEYSDNDADAQQFEYLKLLPPQNVSLQESETILANAHPATDDPNNEFDVYPSAWDNDPAYRGRKELMRFDEAYGPGSEDDDGYDTKSKDEAEETIEWPFGWTSEMFEMVLNDQEMLDELFSDPELVKELDEWITKAEDTGMTGAVDKIRGKIIARRSVDPEPEDSDSYDSDDGSKSPNGTNELRILAEVEGNPGPDGLGFVSGDLGPRNRPPALAFSKVTLDPENDEDWDRLDEHVDTDGVNRSVESNTASNTQWEGLVPKKIAAKWFPKKTIQRRGLKPMSMSTKAFGQYSFNPENDADWDRMDGLGNMLGSPSRAVSMPIGIMGKKKQASDWTQSSRPVIQATNGENAKQQMMGAFKRKGHELHRRRWKGDDKLVTNWEPEELPKDLKQILPDASQRRMQDFLDKHHPRPRIQIVKEEIITTPSDEDLQAAEDADSYLRAFLASTSQYLPIPQSFDFGAPTEQQVQGKTPNAKEFDAISDAGFWLIIILVIFCVVAWGVKVGKDLSRASFSARVRMPEEFEGEADRKKYDDKEERGEVRVPCSWEGDDC